MAERQTHPTQNRATARSWEFESPSRDHRWSSRSPTATAAGRSARPARRTCELRPLTLMLDGPLVDVDGDPSWSFLQVEDERARFFRAPNRCDLPAAEGRRLAPAPFGPSAPVHLDPATSPPVPHRALCPPQERGRAPGDRGPFGTRVTSAQGGASQSTTARPERRGALQAGVPGAGTGGPETSVGPGRRRGGGSHPRRMRLARGGLANARPDLPVATGKALADGRNHRDSEPVSDPATHA